ncbi:kinase-like domain-containing protein [Xylariaceae sp. FL0255]|nr:kinase-like domain-containing protein [Xylariaceae sp. FL0255]
MIEPYDAVLSRSMNRDSTIWLIKPHFIVKWGTGVTPVEAQNMLFIQAHTNIPIPRLYAARKEGACTILFMEYIEGTRLDQVASTFLTSDRLRKFTEQLKSHIEQIRTIPLPNPPFYAERENEAETEFLALRTKFIKLVLSNDDSAALSKPRFTHGWMCDENIIVRADGSPVWIDWSMAGFFPLYWDAVYNSKFLEKWQVSTGCEDVDNEIRLIKAAWDRLR